DMRSIVTRASWIAALRSSTFPLTSSAAFASAQYSVKAAAPAGQSSGSLVFHFFRESRISAARWTLRRSAGGTGVLIGGIVAAGWPDGDCGRKAGARVKATAVIRAVFRRIVADLLALVGSGFVPGSE